MMYTKYKRFDNIFNDIELEEFFDWLISNNWEIIKYDENISGYNLHVVIVAGKIMEKIL